MNISVTFAGFLSSIFCVFQGSSRGDLYIDDYKSFDYKKGEFSHRQFVFENNVLVNR